ncbi:MAG: PD40 domain-containing protein [Anaerolineae bacterium]|nr:PD40 domain-containing protein [Anaerolineae bacterium]
MPYSLKAVLGGLALIVGIYFSVPAVALAQEGDGQAYIIQADDTLWKVAEKYLGDGNRFTEIITATNAKHADDAGFLLIQDPNIIVSGAKLWIPAAGALPAETQPSAPVVAAAAQQTPVSATNPSGHIAFSFWNNSPERCTYEINVIDVPACLKDGAACQANRRVFVLNNVSEPALSPDGTRLAFRGWGEPTREDSPYADCAEPVPARYLANTTLDGTELRGTGGFWEDSHPDWSPDSKRLLFDTGRNGDGIIRILVINADGSGEEDLRIAGQQPSWAPDNDRFVYRGCDVTGNRCGLWLARAIPAKPWETGFNMLGPVVQEAEAAHPDWSPIGNQIAYQSPAGGSWDLYIINADGAGKRQLTSDGSIEGLPAWSPDGQWIAYLSDAGGNWGIWLVRADGSERRQLFAYDGGIYKIPKVVEPYFTRDWLDEQISWSK